MEARAMLILHLAWAYVDPVTVLPITSLVATVVGVLVLCGNGIVQSFARMARLARLYWRGNPVTDRPHSERARCRRCDYKATSARRYESHWE
jgi:hypothetical protein